MQNLLSFEQSSCLIKCSLFRLTSLESTVHQRSASKNYQVIKYPKTSCQLLFNYASCDVLGFLKINFLSLLKKYTRLSFQHNNYLPFCLFFTLNGDQ